ncbi:MAG: hypothetical protein IT256_04780 [Chitinophagaceae bacterium]|nr:hypothetical protein [Chitinophagaceae bacterium]
MTQEPSSVFDDIFSHNAKAHLLETTRWTKFLAILAMIFLTLFFVVFIVLLFNSNSRSMLSVGNNMAGAAGGMLFLILLLLLYVYPIWMLFRFSSLIKSGLLNNDLQQLEQGFKCQKNMFKFMGIFAIVGLALYVVVIAITVFDAFV